MLRKMTEAVAVADVAQVVAVDAAEIVAIDKCSTLFAQAAATKHRFPLSQIRLNLFIAATASRSLARTKRYKRYAVPFADCESKMK